MLFEGDGRGGASQGGSGDFGGVSKCLDVAMTGGIHVVGGGGGGGGGWGYGGSGGCGGAVTGVVKCGWGLGVTEVVVGAWAL